MTNLTVPKAKQIVTPGYWLEAKKWADAQNEISVVEENTRKLSALVKYIRDKSQRIEVERATRYLEIRIGELLGKPTKTYPGKMLRTHAKHIVKDDRHRFRALAEHKKQVLILLKDGVTARSRILRDIGSQQDEKTEGTVMQVI